MNDISVHQVRKPVVLQCETDQFIAHGYTGKHTHTQKWLREQNSFYIWQRLSPINERQSCFVGRVHLLNVTQQKKEKQVNLFSDAIIVTKFLPVIMKYQSLTNTVRWPHFIHFLSTTTFPRWETLRICTIFNFSSRTTLMPKFWLHIKCHNCTGRLPLNLLIKVMLPWGQIYLILWPLGLSSKHTLRTNFTFLAETGRSVNPSECSWSLYAPISSGLVWWRLQPKGTIRMLSRVSINYRHNDCLQEILYQNIVIM